ncbi:hypothetical protein BO99DRAFT_432524 [Aspergillus violaceofuscus CBS 115571]|uniref:Uncharacterized protein n=1 Tax=Aspergillus violaceofuscus (strain CBS 115571) TaxID=1450538 RepID=A0A2V5H5Y5_ASPV1|nr:hypothetical protein BO99DRAFT_432524 [Aspergillus violaceofuscus CBS 115571]
MSSRKSPTAFYLSYYQINPCIHGRYRFSKLPQPVALPISIPEIGDDANPGANEDDAAAAAAAAHALHTERQNELLTLAPGLTDGWNTVKTSGSGTGTMRIPSAAKEIEFSVQITYTTRRPLEFNGPERRLLNEDCLTEQAFQPKTFKIRLEYGQFFHQWETQRTGVPDWSYPYALRLVFDPSPYPPREEWTAAWGDAVLDYQRFWQRTEFCGHHSQLPRERGLRNSFKSWLGYP